MKVIIIPLIVFCLLVGFSCSFQEKCFEGVYDHAEYLQGNWSNDDKTVIYFQDGRTCMFQGYKNIEFQRGDYVRIKTIRCTGSTPLLVEIQVMEER